MNMVHYLERVIERRSSAAVAVASAAAPLLHNLDTLAQIPLYEQNSFIASAETLVAKASQSQNTVLTEHECNAIWIGAHLLYKKGVREKIPAMLKLKALENYPLVQLLLTKVQPPNILNLSEILQPLRKSLDFRSNDPDLRSAWLFLGRNYYLGTGTAEYLKQAFDSFEKATALQPDNPYNSEAWLLVAECHYHGHGTQKNIKKAFACYKKIEDLIVSDDMIHFRAIALARRRLQLQQRQNPLLQRQTMLCSHLL